MSNDPITASEFKFYTQGQTALWERIAANQSEAMNRISSNQNEINSNLTELIAVLRLEHETTKATLRHHIETVGVRKIKTDKKFKDLFEIVDARQGYFRFAGYIKTGIWVIVLAVAGNAATDWYREKFPLETETLTKAQPKNEVKP